MNRVFILLVGMMLATMACAQEKTSELLNGKKVAVVYFSVTGNTRDVAQKIAKMFGAAVFEIVPDVPYTSADLDWHDNKSRSSLEMSDEKSRPAFKQMKTDFSDYDVVFVGYPIWWGKAPHIMRTFAAAANWGNATVYPFCTSGSSAIGTSAKVLEALSPSGATWKDGKRMSRSVTDRDIEKWVQ